MIKSLKQYLSLGGFCLYCGGGEMKKNTFIVSKLMCDFEKQIATAFKEMNNLMAFLTLNEKFSEVSESDIKKKLLML